MIKRIGLLISVLLLGACAYVNNSHPRNALPLKAGERRFSYGIASTNQISCLGRYKPDTLNEVIQSGASNNNALQTPMLSDYGLGNGYALGFQGEISIGPCFKGNVYDQLYAEITLGYDLKVNVQKSFNLGQNTYFAVFPGGEIAKGIEPIVNNYRNRFERLSLELPITVSKLYEYSPNVEHIFSLTARGAMDWLHSDINGPGEGAWSTIDYLDQPLNRFQRYAIMGHMDIRIRKNLNITLQGGAEHSSGESSAKWGPIFYLGMGRKMKPLF